MTSPAAGILRVSASSFFDGDTMHGPTVVTVEEGTVTDIAPFGGSGTDHHLLVPGLVDVQMNGWDTVDVAGADPASMERLGGLLALEGTTHWLGTVTTDSLPRLSDSLERLDQVVRGGTTGAVGIHVEGPFLGSATGAHPREHVVPVSHDWIGSLPRSVRMVTMGAEQDGFARAAGQLLGAGAVVSIGHSRPDAAQFDAAVSAGATMVTHLYNAMSGVHHRDDGLALSALTDPRVRVGLIADLAHVSASAVRLAFLAKPNDVVLVSDSVAWNGSWASARGVTVRDGAPRLPDGTLAGSSTSLLGCVRNVVRHCGVDISTALRSATTAPARLIGRGDIGCIKVGQAFSAVSLAPDLDVSEVWRGLQSSRGNSTHR
ncbi:MAG: N-acetylglucosamine-6-phosphate deacetylase [Actinomycetota bacterium]